jgi:crotonobetainyl-CoA:carnitine CoA-transferase CaiB-like acyl-CoA transferase
MIGEPDGPPYFYMLGIGDVMTGTHLLAAINGALYYRERTGEGQYVDASLLDSYFHCHEVNVQAHTASGGEIKPHRSGAHHYAVSPLGIFKCAEGFVVIAVLQNQWSNFCAALGNSALADDPRFADNAARVENRDALSAYIEAALAKFPSAIEAAEEWGFKYHIPVAPILSIEQAVKHPHLIERETIRTISDPVFGSYQVPGMPLRFSAGPRHPELHAAYLGEHNVDVFTRYAGVSEAEVRELESAGALISKPDA